MGSLSDLYQSIENLSTTYMQPNQNKYSLLNPTVSISAGKIPLLLSVNHQPAGSNDRNVCNCYDREFVLCSEPSIEIDYPCRCKVKITNDDEKGFVKGVVTYMVMDNLEVKPMSTISSITLLNQFNVQNVQALKEKTVVLGVDEGLKILKASLECKNVLTSVFLGNNGGEKRSRS
ncbi:hypothetical protein LWI29_037078 [Acer saccharum]|uniref:Uncharacterized protein n=1 Tax=Acer saccharum TaxID=4024 RepID=A0AA39SKE1_ACESA|nr:hypothetical protein LWI29_037078 [Acer saccharum]